jgi:hypothetical protein
MPSNDKNLSRRRFFERSIEITGAGVVAGLSLEEQALLAHAQSPAAGKGPRTPVAASGPRETLPTGKIGPLTVSRLICGGNLFSGSAHSRNLIYVSNLLKNYFSPERIIDTLQLCEESGINTTILRCDEHITGVLARYRKERGGKMQWIAQTYPTLKDLTGNIQMAIDHGAVGIFPQGGIGDDFVAKGRVDLLGKVVDFVKQNRLAAGIGSHALDVPKAVEKAGIRPDFYFKTFNDVGYNTQDPREVADFMKTVDRPWIAFKVLGAGVVKPRDGFGLAFRMGADFLNVGMFDFQVREDAAVVRSLLAKDLPRERPWRS